MLKNTNPKKLELPEWVKEKHDKYRQDAIKRNQEDKPKKL